MKRHVKIYLDHHGYGIEDIILCEKRGPNCENVAVDIHHKLKKSLGGTDDIENLEAVCRNCHDIEHDLKC